ARAVGRVGWPAVRQRQDPAVQAQTGTAAQEPGHAADRLAKPRQSVASRYDRAKRMSNATPANGSPARPTLVVSACLLGVPCNHRGGGSPSAAVAALAGRYQLAPVCPEVAGGLPIPRAAAELQPDGRV